jgi:hypothetical protein
MLPGKTASFGRRGLIFGLFTLLFAVFGLFWLWRGKKSLSELLVPENVVKTGSRVDKGAAGGTNPVISDKFDEQGLFLDRVGLERGELAGEFCFLK